MFKIDLKDIPSKPGVYTFIDEKGKIIYVGKAKSLKKRIQSYFINNNDHDQKKISMLKVASDLKFIVTKNEVEAFLLEANLIKNEKPKYNVMLKDAKGYPYIKLTDEAFPKLEYTRNTLDNKAIYFGPFIDIHGLKELLAYLQKMFPIRTCSNSVFRQKKLCLKYQIKKCSGPCEGKISKEEHDKLVYQIREFFKGNIKSVKNEFSHKMKMYVADLQFEKAAELRDKINTLDRLFTEQAVIYKGRECSIDGFVFHNFKGVMGLTQLFIRAGRLIGIKTVFFDSLIDNDLMLSTMFQFYNNTRQFPDKIICYSSECELDTSILSKSLNTLVKEKISIEISNNKYKSIIDFALNNAEEQTDLYLNKLSRDKNVLAQLAQCLKMQSPPVIIECIDISHMSGSHTVGVSIVYEKNGYNKSLYRKYKIKSVTNDDFKAVYEVMYRKGQRIIKNIEKPADIYIIDGGLGQLNAAVKAFNDLNIKNTGFISIAKGRSKHNREIVNEHYSVEDIFIYGRKNKLNLRKNDPVLLFIQRLRDEAHMSAIRYNRQLLLKHIDDSPLKNIKGVGPKRLKMILEKFSDIYNNENINEHDLIKHCHVPAVVAKNIISYLRTRD
jgi:excinuclease ABC subunit C